MAVRIADPWTGVRRCSNESVRALRALQLPVRIHRQVRFAPPAVLRTTAAGIFVDVEDVLAGAGVVDLEQDVPAALVGGRDVNRLDPVDAGPPRDGHAAGGRQ